MLALVGAYVIAFVVLAGIELPFIPITSAATMAVRKAKWMAPFAFSLLDVIKICCAVLLAAWLIRCIGQSSSWLMFLIPGCFMVQNDFMRINRVKMGGSNVKRMLERAGEPESYDQQGDLWVEYGHLFGDVIGWIVGATLILQSASFFGFGEDGLPRGNLMLWIFLGASFLLGIITGFVLWNKGALFHRMAGQSAQGVLSMACVVMIAVAFWKFGWQIGVLAIPFILTAVNIGRYIFNALFRDRVTLEMPSPDGHVKTIEVTKKWVEKMEGEEKMKPISPPTVKVNILDPTGGLNGDDFDDPGAATTRDGPHGVRVALRNGTRYLRLGGDGRRRYPITRFPGRMRYRLALRLPSLGRGNGEDERPGDQRQVRARAAGAEVA